MYYLRTKAASDAIKFTVDKKAIAQPTAKAMEEQKAADLACSLDNPDDCVACGS